MKELREHEQREHALAKYLKQAIMEVVADFSDCDLLAPMSDIICELDSRKMLSASALVDVIEQWLQEGAHWPPNTGPDAGPDATEPEPHKP